MRTQRFRTSNGAHIAYTDDGLGAPVVLLHGLGSRGAHWDLQRPSLLEAGRRVIAVDLRFHGASDSTGNGHRIARLGRDVQELAEHLQLGDTALVGHSMGVSVALAALSLGEAAWVNRLVIVDQSARIINDRDWTWGLWDTTQDTFEDQLAGRRPWGRWVREPGPAPAAGAMLRAHPMAMPSAAHAALVRDHFVADWRDEAPRIGVPTWIATGAARPAYPAEAMDWLTRTLPDGRLTIFPRSGHTPHWSEPEQFSEQLVQFLTA